MNSDNNGKRFEKNTDKPNTSFMIAALIGASVLLCLLTLGELFAKGVLADGAVSLNSGFLGLVFTVVACAIIAFIGCVRPVLVLVAPLAAITVSAVILIFTKNKISVSFIMSLSGWLIPLSGGVALSLATVKKWRRTSAVIAVSAGLGLSYLLLLATDFYIIVGAFSPGLLIETFNSQRDILISELSNNLGELSAIYGTKISEQLIALAVNSFFNYLPALAILSFCILGFFSQKILFLIFKSQNMQALLDEDMKEFLPSKITAIMFIASYALSFLAPAASLVKAVADNVYIILEPALTLVGIVHLMPKRVNNVVRIGCLPFISIAFLFFFAPSLAVLMLAVMGTIKIFRTSKKQP